MRPHTPASDRVDLPGDDDLEVLQLRTAGLGDNSYVVRAGGELAVVDAQRDLDRVEPLLEALGGRLVAVLETHVHNDYVSGGPVLARRHGATLVVPADAGYDLEHRPVRDGDEIAVGPARLRALHTPGHTPHHTSYALLDSGGREVTVFTGGCVLVGACGRTDLISPALTEELTRSQYRSARRVGGLPDPTTVAPTHGAGSFCAASAASADTWSTVALEKGRNPAFLATGEDDFVRTQLAGLLAYPAYYAHMAAINRRGAEAWEPHTPPALSVEQLEEQRRDGAVVVDGRMRHVFAAGHIPGSVNIELDPSFSTYVGWILPYGAPLALVLDPDQDATEAVRQCARLGMESVAGVLEGGVDAWRAAGRPLRSYPSGDVDTVARATGGTPLDVRQDAEWTAGRIPAAHHLHVADVPGRVEEARALPGPLLVYCRTGHRAAIAASLLDAAGIDVVHIDGGFPDWQARGLPVER